ncbi:MAG: hypothetical protein PHW83_02880 [Bacteroidales bacterium]|nr:hypothetical protein [Bacteroidales bacterium]
MRTKLIYSVIITMMIITMNSCIKDNFDFDKWDQEVQYDASFALPAAWGDLAFVDFIELYDSTGLLIENEDGYVSLQYKAYVNSDTVQSIIYLNNQETSGTVTSPVFNFAGFDDFGDTISYVYTQDMAFTMFNPEAEIDSILLKTGILDVATNSTYGHSARLYITFPTVTKNGVPFSKTFTYVTGGGYANSLNNDFSGYKVDMTQTATGFNEIPVNIRLTLYYSGSSVPNTGTLTFDADMKGMRYSMMHGYFGLNTLFFESDTIDINLFRNEDWEIERYEFRDPKFNVYYWNSYGIPSQFYFTHLMANSAIDDMDYNIIDYGVGLPVGESNPFDVSYATVAGESKLDSLKLNKTNSNIADVVNKRPKWIQFKAKATTNPAGNNHNNFVTEDSEIAVEVVMELPLWGYIYNFNMRDTMEIDVDDLFNEYNPITRALVRLDIKNGLPVEVFGQVYFADQYYNILDSIFYTYQERLLSAAEVDENGRVIDFSRKVTKIEYDEERLEKLRSCKYMIYGGQANTTGANVNEVVKIYSDYRLIFDVGFEVDLELEGHIDSISNELE